jgi:hypothetical protein
MTTIPPASDATHTPKNLKGSIEHVEEHGHVHNPKEAALDAAAQGQITSGYETLSLWETVMTFKVSTAVCFAAAFSAATDGYQIGSVQAQFFGLVAAKHYTIR